MTTTESHAYVHLPFCARRCPYCDFNAHAGRDADMDAYADALLVEARTRLSGQGLKTLYVGGGTPTYGDAERLARILAGLRDAAGGRIEEFTVEGNPGSIDREKVAVLVDAGVERVSVGAQSFHDTHLRTLGRIHQASEIDCAVEELRAAGIARVSLDLILAIPGQTLDEQAEDLSRVVGLEPEHVSAYVLTIEEGTPFERRVRLGQLPAPDDERDIAHLHLAVSQFKSAGYERYEISNFARPGEASQHNLAYWRDADWVGLGAGAHSHVGSRRWKNVDDPAAYARAVAGAGDVVEWAEETTPEVALFDALMMGLRLVEGVDCDALAGRIGIDPRDRYEEVIAAHERDGLLVREGPRLRLTPRGMDLTSYVLRSLL